MAWMSPAWIFPPVSRMAVSIIEYYADHGIDCIDIDQAAGIFGLIRHLESTGHRRVGFLTWRYAIETPWAYRRFGAYAESLQRLGLDYRPEWSINLNRRDHSDPGACARRVAEQGVGLVALGGPVRRRAQTGGRAIVDEGPAFIRLAVVVGICPNNDLAETITVDVAGRSHRDTKVGVGLIALVRPVGRGGKSLWVV